MKMDDSCIGGRCLTFFMLGMILAMVLFFQSSWDVRADGTMMSKAADNSMENASETEELPETAISYTFEDGVLTLSGTGNMTDDFEIGVNPDLVNSIVIEDGITDISSCRFENFENVSSVTIPSSVTSIGSGAFRGCYSLKTIKLPDNLKSIGEYAFAGSSVKNITIPESVQSIGDNVFYNCNKLCKIVNNSQTKVYLKNVNMTRYYHVDKGETKYCSVQWYYVEGQTILSTDTSYIGRGTVVWAYSGIAGLDDREFRVGDKVNLTSVIRTIPDTLDPVLPEITYQWSSSDESVASVDQNGILTAHKLGMSTITIISSTGQIYSEKIYVTAGYEKGVQRGNITWYIPEKIKVGYAVHTSAIWECTGVRIAEIKNLPEDSVGKDIICKAMDPKTGLGFVENFTYPHAGAYESVVTDRNHAVAKTVLEHAVRPGTVRLQVKLDGQVIGEPYTVEIEEPEITTNAPKRVEVGSSLNLKAELTNTALKDELVDPYKKKIADALANDERFHDHKLVFEPELTIVEGQNIVRVSDYDVSHSLTASEILTFTGTGTVKVKIKYNLLKTCCFPNNTDNGWLSYAPEKVVTIQVGNCNHTWGAWKTETAATVFQPGMRTRTCSACNKTESQTIPKSKPAMKLNASVLKLKKKQATTALKVSGLAAGDSVQAYKSSDTRIFTVNQKGKITAKSKLGSAKLTITLKSGLKKTITVKVQNIRLQQQKLSWIQKRFS